MLTEYAPLYLVMRTEEASFLSKALLAFRPFNAELWLLIIASILALSMLFDRQRALNLLRTCFPAHAAPRPLYC